MHGLLPIAIAARAAGLDSLILPADNELEAAVVDGLSLYPMRTLAQTVALLRGAWAPEPRRFRAL